MQVSFTENNIKFIYHTIQSNNTYSQHYFSQNHCILKHFPLITVSTVSSTNTCTTEGPISSTIQTTPQLPLNVKIDTPRWFCCYHMQGPQIDLIYIYLLIYTTKIPLVFCISIHERHPLTQNIKEMQREKTSQRNVPVKTPEWRAMRRYRNMCLPSGRDATGQEESQMLEQCSILTFLSDL